MCLNNLRYIVITDINGDLLTYSLDSGELLDDDEEQKYLIKDMINVEGENSYLFAYHRIILTKFNDSPWHIFNKIGNYF